jgi:hypothetical protein
MKQPYIIQQQCSYAYYNNIANIGDIIKLKDLT